MRLLVTGGSGTLGKELVKRLHETQERLVVFSRDEFKQSEMQKIYPEGGEKGLRYFIGDVRDFDRLKFAFKDIDCIIHAAAFKRIEVCEYNPSEALQTNVIGSWNVIRAAIECNVKKVILVSTDKAPNASTMYGASKLMAERLFISANNLSKTRFSIVRYGNVIGSRGSVFDIWKQQAAERKPLTITDKRMTRYFFTIEEAAQFVLKMLERMEGGEIFLPKMQGFSVFELAEKISKNIVETGMRGLEKMHETLLTDEESRCCYENDGFYTIMPSSHDWSRNMTEKGVKVPEGFRLMSYDGRISDFALKNGGMEEAPTHDIFTDPNL